MSTEDLEEEIKMVKLKTFDIEKISESVQEPESGDDDDESGNGGRQGGGGSITSVRPMATVEEVVIAINLRFKNRISPEGVSVVENYLQALQKTMN